MLKPELISNGRTRTLMAVLVLAHPVTSVHDVAKATGLSPTTVHFHLTRLAGMGLVSFDRGKHGTLRPNCEVVR